MLNEIFPHICFIKEIKNGTNVILASEKDWEIFFNALANPTDPNQKLMDAAERYKLFVQENK